MKTLIFRMFAAIGFGLMVVTGALGQIGQTYRANIPFDFVIHGGTMRSGSYQLTPISSTQCHRAILIQDLDRKNPKILGSAACGTAVPNFDQLGTLTFWKNLDKFVLVSVDTPTIQMKMKGAWTEVQVLSRTGKVPEIVTIALR